MRRGAGTRFGAGAAAPGALAAICVLGLASPAGASAAPAGPGAGGSTSAVQVLHLRAMPAGTATFGWRHGRLTVRTVMFGLTPGSSHRVSLMVPGRSAGIEFSPLTANSLGQASATLRSRFSGRLPHGIRLLIRLGTGGGQAARGPIAETRRLSHPGRRPHRLIAVEVSAGGARFGPPRGQATLSYSARRQTLTVTVTASGVTPGPHAAHIHLGSCMSQGPVKYMLRDLVASRHGRITHAVRVFTHVTAPVPAHGWYLNIHQGNSGDIVSGGQPTMLFRPLLCADTGGQGSGSIGTILRTGDIVTGVRGTGSGNVILTGSAPTGSGAQTAPFLYPGRLTNAAGAAVSVLAPPFPGVTSGTFYGPDTHFFNPASIPAGQVRAVGSYQSSSAPAGVINQGMIYLGPVSGPGGSWKSIAVTAHGARTAGHLRACPRRRPHCFVMDTIAHSTMGNLVVGNYDLKPTVHGGLISANAFIYNMTSRQWTLLRLRGSQSTQATLYGIWQDGGPGSPRYTLAGGSAASGTKQAFLMNYNERTGHFGAPEYFSYGNHRDIDTHFEGITAVRGGFNLVALSAPQGASMAFIPVRARNGHFGRATWFRVNVMNSPLCAGDCSLVTANSVYRNQVMGIYDRKGSSGLKSYLATVAGR
jgi:hypothetical protein